ncbi:MAG: hypothetical protein WC076_08620 [Terrimicrobiaceae bacterium]|jgi:hypothetical protein
MLDAQMPLDPAEEQFDATPAQTSRARLASLCRAVSIRAKLGGQETLEIEPHVALGGGLAPCVCELTTSKKCEHKRWWRKTVKTILSKNLNR